VLKIELAVACLLARMSTMRAEELVMGMRVICGQVGDGGESGKKLFFVRFFDQSLDACRAVVGNKWRV
jgi:hypothetical protein